MVLKPLNNILVKPAGPDCNMACPYCFYHGKGHLFPGTGTHRMTETVLETMLRQLMRQPVDMVSIGWQGGEPTLMGLPFFERAVALEEKYGRGKTVGNGFQTNGLLLDQSWARFFRKYQFLIGLSIDGPEAVHDHGRCLPGGGPTWARVTRTARMLLDAGVAVNALAVIHGHSVGFPDEIYAALKSLGLTYMQFIPYIDAEQGDTAGSASFAVSADAYGAFLCRIFDLWRADFVNGVPSTSVRYFESLLHAYAGLPPPECTLHETCGDYVVIEHNGDVYACDFFVEPAWRLGNVLESDLADLLNSPQQQAFGGMKARLPDTCPSCRWFPKCRGGCTRQRPGYGATGARSSLCEAYKAFFNHADAEMTRLIADWKKKQVIKENGQDPRRGPIGRNEPCPCGSGRKYKKCCGR